MFALPTLSRRFLLRAVKRPAAVPAATRGHRSTLRKLVGVACNFAERGGPARCNRLLRPQFRSIFLPPGSAKHVFQGADADVGGGNGERAFVGDWVDDAEHSVVMFAKTTCGFCGAAQSLLEQHGAKVTTVYLDLRHDGFDLQSELLDITGQRTVPSIWIGGNFLGGFSDIRALAEEDLRSAIEAAA